MIEKTKKVVLHVHMCMLSQIVVLIDKRRVVTFLLRWPTFFFVIKILTHFYFCLAKTLAKTSCVLEIFSFLNCCVDPLLFLFGENSGKIFVCTGNLVRT